MARKLKTFTTSAGFFDLAVAAPSMKAALEAWGSRNNLFQHGFAKVSEDPKIVAATMAHPGVVLRRPVGSTALSANMPSFPRTFPPKRQRTTPSGRRRSVRRSSLSRRRRQSTTRPLARPHARSRRSRSGATASAAGKRPTGDENVSAASGPSRQPKPLLKQARQDHEARLEDIEKDRAALDKRSQAEDARWRKKKEELEAELRKARSGSHLRLV